MQPYRQLCDDLCLASLSNFHREYLLICVEWSVSFPNFKQLLDFLCRIEASHETRFATLLVALMPSVTDTHFMNRLFVFAGIALLQRLPREAAISTGDGHSAAMSSARH